MKALVMLKFRVISPQKETQPKALYMLGRPSTTKLQGGVGF